MRKKKSKPLIGKVKSLNPISIKIISGDPELDIRCDQIWKTLEAITKDTEESAKAEIHRLENDVETYVEVIKTLEAEDERLYASGTQKREKEIIKQAIQSVFENYPTLPRTLGTAWSYIHMVNIQGCCFEKKEDTLICKDESGKKILTREKISLERLVSQVNKSRTVIK